MSNKSTVWSYFKRLEENPSRAKCNACSRDFGCKDSQTTTMRNHLKAHPDIFEAFSAAEEAKAKTSLKRKSDVVCEKSNIKQPKLNFAGIDYSDKQKSSMKAYSDL